MHAANAAPQAPTALQLKVSTPQLLLQKHPLVQKAGKAAATLLHARSQQLVQHDKLAVHCTPLACQLVVGKTCCACCLQAAAAPPVFQRPPETQARQLAQPANAQAETYQMSPYRCILPISAHASVHTTPSRITYIHCMSHQLYSVACTPCIALFTLLTAHEMQSTVF